MQRQVLIIPPSPLPKKVVAVACSILASNVTNLELMKNEIIFKISDLYNGVNFNNCRMLISLISNNLYSCNVLPRVLGGKGGFGSNLRAAGGQMAKMKSTNYESCRDLNGRRLRTIHSTQAVAKWKLEEPKRKRDAEEKLLKKIQKAIEAPHKKKAFRDKEFLESTKDIISNTEYAVHEAMYDKEVGDDKEDDGENEENSNEKEKEKKESPSPASESTIKFSHWDLYSEIPDVIN